MQQQTDNKERIKRLAQRVMALPPLPTLVAKLIELIDDPRTSAASLGKLISTDQVMTARVLKIANSAFYGFTRRIATVNLAIVVLGFDALKDLCVTVSLRDWFPGDDEDGDLDMSLFWEHSIGTGVAGRLIARETGYKISGEVFVAGLLHDIGKLVLKQYLREEFREITQLVRHEDRRFVEAELEVLGLHHGTIGRWLVEKWNLPEHLAEAVAWHHEPANATTNYPLTATVHFANYLVRTCGVGFSGDHLDAVLDPAVVANLNLRLTEEGALDLPYYQELLREELEKTETFLNVIRNEPPQSERQRVVYGSR
jgi:putative nucleotidyltransferase with HDIG domain